MTSPLIAVAACAVLGIAGCTSSIGDSLKSMTSWATPKKPSKEPVETTSVFAKKPEASADLHVATARVYEANGNYTAAADEYQKALKKSPNNVVALLSYAHLLDHDGKLPEATKMYTQATKVAPNEPAAYNDLGLCLARRGMTKDSIKALTKAVDLQPSRPLYRNNLATVLVEANRQDEALAQLKAVHPEAVAHYNLAVLLQQHKQDVLAQTHFRRALELDPTFAAAREWCDRLSPQQAGQTQVAGYERVVVPPSRVAVVPAPSPRAGSYGAAPDPQVVSNYLRPEPTPTIQTAQPGDRYASFGGAAGQQASPQVVRASDSMQPPTPESVSNYQPTLSSELHFLPPVQ